jgi:type IV secretion system protein VirB5
MIRQTWRRAIRAAASGGALWFLALPAAAQIPVIDPAAIAKQIEQITELRTQLETAKDQLTQLQSLHGSLNKLTNMGDIAALLSNPAVRQALPKDFGQLEAALKGQGSGALGSRAESYARDNEVYARTGDDFYAAETRRAQLANAGQTSVAQQVYEAASRRMDGLDELRRQIGQSEDPKTTLDLQARIGSESAHLQNELLKMQALHMLQQAEVQTREQRAREDWDRRIDGNIRALGGTPSNP